jgi:hypothetical protein
MLELLILVVAVAVVGLIMQVQEQQETLMVRLAAQVMLSLPIGHKEEIQWRILHN